MMSGPLVADPVAPLLNEPKRWNGLPTHRRPSPSGTCACAPAIIQIPSLNVGMFVTLITRSSESKLVVPAASSSAPKPVEFAQPAVASSLPHGPRPEVHWQ